VSAWRVWTELKAPGTKLLNFTANAASTCQFLIGQDQICPDGASLGTKKFVLLDVGLKRPYGASCGTKTVFSSFFLVQQGFHGNRLSREKK
jgi:hypothetical protein